MNIIFAWELLLAAALCAVILLWFMGLAYEWQSFLLI